MVGANANSDVPPAWFPLWTSLVSHHCSHFRLDWLLVPRGHSSHFLWRLARFSIARGERVGGWVTRLGSTVDSQKAMLN